MAVRVTSRKLVMVVIIVLSVLVTLTLSTYVMRRSHKPQHSAAQLKNWASQIVASGDSSDFLFDGVSQQLHQGSPELKEVLSAMGGFRCVYPVRVGNEVFGYVFATEMDTWTTRGYLVTTGRLIPSRHRTGPFEHLERLDAYAEDGTMLVFYFQSK